MKNLVLGATLVLRDIHQPPAPAWWPPAPGWWLLAGLLVALMVAVAFFFARQRQRRRAITALFDATVDAAPTATAQVAAMSELLRRAARRREPSADRLHGDAWLAFLDAGDPQRAFAQGAGRLLLDGGYRREADPRDVAALRELARSRFLAWTALR